MGLGLNFIFHESSDIFNVYSYLFCCLDFYLFIYLCHSKFNKVTIVFYHKYYTLLIIGRNQLFIVHYLNENKSEYLHRIIWNAIIEIFKKNTSSSFSVTTKCQKHISQL